MTINDLKRDSPVHFNQSKEQVPQHFTDPQNNNDHSTMTQVVSLPSSTRTPSLEAGFFCSKSNACPEHSHEPSTMNPSLWKGTECRRSPTFTNDELANGSITMDSLVLKLGSMGSTKSDFAPCKLVTGAVTCFTKARTWLTPQAPLTPSVCLAKVGASLCTLPTAFRFASLPTAMTNATASSTPCTPCATGYSTSLATAMRDTEQSTSMDTLRTNTATLK
ncbi:hypothetical protein Cgig2_007903 [Carnegiea gigantea]|uniref:Uncharacterized protein n=1 Tax=Carnegiea gigantea TaxID=171969 RepID=A0A9Q1QJ38_9CARY|nr:hypothetical protein Cgig2_007903 [Carnegiea gigantea]